jgi:autotransporter-associated beta strand protein
MRRESHRSRRAQFVLVAATLAVAASAASAQTYRWTRGTGNSGWDQTTGANSVRNWESGAPPAVATVPVTPPIGGVTDILFSGTPLNANSSNLRQPYTITSLTFSSDFLPTVFDNAISFTVSSTTGLAGQTRSDLTILEGGIVSNIGRFNISIAQNTGLPGDLIVGANQNWYTVGGLFGGTSAQTFTISRPISNTTNAPTATVTKTGPGLLVLAQTTANSNWTTGLILNEGSVRTGGLASSHNGHFGTGPIVSTSSNDVSITASIVGGAGGDRNFPNSLTLGGSGRLSFQGSFPLNFTSASTWTLVGNKNLATSISTTHDGRITGPFGLTKLSGGILILNGSSDFTGGVTISEGVLRARNSNALGSGAAGVSVAAWDGTTNTVGGRLELDGGITVSGKPLLLGGVGYTSTTPPTNVQTGNGALRNLSGANTWSGPVTITSPGTIIQIDAGTVLTSGGITGNPGTSLSVSNAGSGALTTKHVRVPGNLSLLNAGASVIVSADGTSAGASQVGGVVFSGTPAAPTSLLDLVNNRLVVIGGLPSLADLRASARAFITSGETVGLGASAAGGAGRDAVASLGLRPNAPAGIPEYASFAGFSVTPSDVLAMYTYNGDTNLDGKLDAADFNAVLNGLTNGLTGWENGDINYDNAIDSSDWTLFSSAYAFYLGGGLPFDNGGNIAGSIPEPSLLGFALAAPLLLRRRR